MTEAVCRRSHTDDQSSLSPTHNVTHVSMSHTSQGHMPQCPTSLNVACLTMSHASMSHVCQCHMLLNVACSLVDSELNDSHCLQISYRQPVFSLAYTQCHTPLIVACLSVLQASQCRTPLNVACLTMSHASQCSMPLNVTCLSMPHAPQCRMLTGRQ